MSTTTTIQNESVVVVVVPPPNALLLRRLLLLLRPAKAAAFFPVRLLRFEEFFGGQSEDVLCVLSRGDVENNGRYTMMMMMMRPVLKFAKYDTLNYTTPKNWSDD